MDAWMKVLIAITCTCVIAVSAHYGYAKYSDRALENERNARVEGARSELFQFAKAEPHEIEKVKQWCSTTRDLTGVGGTLADNDVAKNLVRNCRALGFL